MNVCSPQSPIVKYQNDFRLKYYYCPIEKLLLRFEFSSFIFTYDVIPNSKISKQFLGKCENVKTNPIACQIGKFYHCKFMSHQRYYSKNGVYPKLTVTNSRQYFTKRKENEKKTAEAKGNIASFYKKISSIKNVLKSLVK